MGGRSALARPPSSLGPPAQSIKTARMNEIQTTMVTCAGGMPAFVASPIGMAKAPVIVLLHERYGLVQHTKDLAARHAREGHVCIAADYFYKHPDQDALHRGEAGYDLTDPEALEYMETAIAEVKHVECADLGRIAAMGVCQTGRHPLVLAAHRPLAAALVWYGAAQDREWKVNNRYPVALDILIERVECPVLGMFGEVDHIISVDHVRKFRACLERFGKSFHVEIFGGAPHGWLNDTMPGRYRLESAEAAWRTQRAFLAHAFEPDRDGSSIRQSYKASISPSYDFSKNVRYE
jgi:carboxymethylenebutenolidase